jgi:hypothetical protein
MKVIIGAIVIIFLMSGCSHKISLSPSLDELRGIKVEKKADVNVGYYISSEAKKTEITTPGGGGDKVKYTPYKDTEAALNTMLSRKFSRVYSLNSINDKNIIENKNIRYIFTTNIHTNSSSSNILIWPPTDFTMDLTCSAIDTNGKKIWNETVSAKGYANFDELMGNFSLSAKRATKEAFSKMLKKLEKANKFNSE